MFDHDDADSDTSAAEDFRALTTGLHARPGTRR